jgi:predicted permease
VRVSLGAGLGRIRRQLLTESTVLALCGGVPGFLLAIWGTRALVALAPDGIPRLSEISVDPRVFCFSMLVTLATGLVFGLAPLVGLEEGTAASALRGAGRRGRARPELLRDAVVVTEVALSLVLVVGAGLMVRTLRALDDVDPGFEPTGVLVAHVSLPESDYADTEGAAAFYAESLDRIRALPGVESAATILTLPMHWAIRGTFGFSIDGRTPDPGEQLLAGFQVASADYFRTLRIPLLRGRDIEAADRKDAPDVVVVNEAMANRYWPGADPVGARITFSGDPDDPDTEWATVVGVVANTVKEGLDRPAEPEAFLSVGQAAMPRSSFVIRTEGDPYALTSAVREAIHDVDPSLPLYGLLSMSDVTAGSLDQRRFRMLLLSAFAGAALLLAAIGLYGVISFSVGQRTREIGIRMALGASRDTLVSRVVRDGQSRVALGLVLGVFASLVLKRAIASQVFGVSVTDPVTYVASILLLGAVAMLATLAPAVRASRVDPAVAVRDA